MGKIVVRVDDRLIHGQTIVAWCPTLAIQEIIAIDDESAKNPMLKSIMTMSVPPLYKTHSVTTEEARSLLSQDSGTNRLVIVRFPKQLEELEDTVLKADFVMLGNIAKRPDSVHKVSGATGIFYLSQQDVEVIDALSAKGADVCFQQLPNTTRTSWDAFRKTIE